MLKVGSLCYSKIKQSPSFCIIRFNSSLVPQTVEEPSDGPEYPPVFDYTGVGKQQQLKDKYFEGLKQVKTVEEKLIALNCPRYYGWPSLLLNEDVIPYDYLQFVQHITRTVLYRTKKLPVSCTNQHTQTLLERIKKQLENALVFEHFGKVRKHEILSRTDFDIDLSDKSLNNAHAKNVILHLNRIFINNLASDYPHLLISQTDYGTRMEAFWRAGGFYPLKDDMKLREIKHYPSKMMDGSIDRCFQYFGRPILTLRNRLPLQPLFERITETPTSCRSLTGVESDSQKMIDAGQSSGVPDVITNITTELDVSRSEQDSDTEYPINPYRYDASVYHSLPRKRVGGISNPGFWPNDVHQFGLLSYHPRGHMLNRPLSFGEVDFKEALHSQAILASYGWLFGQATFKGFNTFNDVTYPFVTQTVITDGKLFNFYVYQLNTTVCHSEYAEQSNPLKNICYGTDTQELYHDITDNGVVGWNDEALLNLLSFYTNTPSNRPNVNLTPYLGEQKVISYIDDVAKRNWLHEKYRNITCRRPRFLKDPEIFEWEQIYKIEFNKRPMEARRRFFELEQDPLNDKVFQDHRPKYIIKSLRKPPYRINKYEVTHYPDILPEYIDIV